MTSHRRPTRLALLVLVVLLPFLAAGCSQTDEPNGVAVDVESFQQTLDQPDVVVLDVRTPQEFASGHLPEARNLDVGSPGFADQVDALDQDATYAVYCQSGNRSGVAVEQMVDQGFTDVVHLDGGILAWQDAGGEIVTD